MTKAQAVHDEHANLPKFLGFLILLWLLISLGSYFLLVAQRGNRFDLFPRWVGARAVLKGESPYSDEVTWQIQEGMFGRRLEPREDQQRFAYSATITWLLLPFWLFPFPWAASLWCGLQLLILLVLPISIAVMFRWRPRSSALILIIIFSTVVFRYPINAYVIGQFIPFCLACLVAGLWGITRGHRNIAVLALVLAMVRPEVVMVPLVVILAAAWRRGDRRVVLAWLAGMLVLWLLTRAWIGPWESDYVRGIVAYQAYSSPIWPPGLLPNRWLAASVVIAVISWTAWMLRELWPLYSTEGLGWQVSVAALSSLLLLPQTGNYTLVLALLPAWVILWASRSSWTAWGPVLVVLASPWLFLVAKSIPSSWDHLLIPASLALLLTFQWRLRGRFVPNDNPAFGLRRA